MARRIKYRSGKVTVELSGEIRDAIDKAIRQVAPRTADVLEAAVTEVVEEAKPKWPVKTGTSKAALDSFVRISKSEIAGVVENPAFKRGKRGKDYYAYMINKGVTWKTLCEKPTLAKVDDVAEQIAEEAAALVGG